MANFTDYVENIEVLTSIENEGDGACVVHVTCSGYGLSGDGGANIELPYIQCSGELVFIPWGGIELSILEIISQNAVEGSPSFPVFEVNGTLEKFNESSIKLPILECSGVGRSGNDGDCYFYLLQVSGEGNANRRYELCE